MKKILLYVTLALVCLTYSACNDDFLDINPQDSVTDEAVFGSFNSTQLYVNDVYGSLKGPLYSWDAMGGTFSRSMFDNAFTDDLVTTDDRWNLFNFTPNNAPFERWTECYNSIRRANLGIEKISASSKLTEPQKQRFLGDLHFLRATFYFELFRLYGRVPVITAPLSRQEDEIYNARNSEEEVLKFIIDEYQLAADLLPKRSALPPTELGRATKGAAVGMKASVYLHAAGVINAAYYKNAYETADVLIRGELAGEYQLFQTGATPELKFQNLFLEENEHNSEVIFDIQYAYPNKISSLQTVSAPPKHSTDDYGFGNRNMPTQEVVDAFEMKDGTSFSWSNPAHAANPYANRDARFYSSVLYNGVSWKGATLFTSANIWSTGQNQLVPNSPNGIGTATNSTITGYYLKKHINPTVISGYPNRGLGIGGGHNLIVLRYAEILLIYAEARNEVGGAADPFIYEAINRVRRRVNQPDILAGLSQLQFRERVRNERRIELAFENKRYFDIVRWREGNRYLNQPSNGIRITYNMVGGNPVASYQRFQIVKKIFDESKNYLLPVPQAAISRNSRLQPNNPGW